MQFANEPWIQRGATEQMRQYIEARPPRSCLAVEFGSGASTLWLAARCQFVLAYEDNATVQAQLATTLRVREALVELGSWSIVLTPREMMLERARQRAEVSPDLSDIIIVDHTDHYRDEPVNRAHVLVAVAPAVKPGGLLILDNSARQPYRWAIEELTREGWGCVHYHEPDERHGIDKAHQTTVFVRA